MSPVSCKGRAELWQHTGAQTCQGHSVNKAQRVEGRNKPFLSPVQRAPLCLSNVAEFVSLKAPSSPSSESDPELTVTTAARILRLCRQEVTLAALEETGTDRGAGEVGHFDHTHPLKGSLLASCLSGVGRRPQKPEGVHGGFTFTDLWRLFQAGMTPSPQPTSC